MKHIPTQFHRLIGVAVAFVLQIALLIFVMQYFSSYFVRFYWLGLSLSLLVSIWISTRKSRLPYKMAWIIPIALFPLFGGMVYFLMTGLRTPAPVTDRALLAEQLQSDTLPADLQLLGIDLVQQAQYLQNAALCPPYRNTETHYFPSGESFFPVLLSELSRAKHYIFLEYFIISEGRMWTKIMEILEEKAAAGVDVRIIYDDFGSLTTLPKHYVYTLQKKGIFAAVFQPLKPFLTVQQNSRDHRKLCVIDGMVGFTGGINLADEYINEIERFGYWKDSALLLRGDAVWTLTVSFLQMWASIRKCEVDYTAFRPKFFPLVATNVGFVQPYIDTPLATDTVCADLHLQMFAKAKRYLYITTPYLIMDETIASVLYSTARSGVDVRIMTPHIPDKRLVFSVTKSHYEALLEAGVKIYEFLPGFIHSKTVVADDLYASVGSCNLDYRSFYLQFENGTWLCGTPSVIAIREDFTDSLAFCQEITLEESRKTPPLIRMFRSLVRIFSPLF